MKKNRAFLKWAGGKYPLLDDIKRHLPKGECLVEPFVGAGSVFLNTDFSRYILADINSDLISLYNIVKMRTDEYVQAARELFVPETNCAEVYYQFREEFNKSQDPFRRAVLFLYLNRYGYNGLCRYNLRGEFNVPFGRYKKPYFPEAELYHFAEKAQNAFFYCESYADSMARADDASVVYCDPPYANRQQYSNATNFDHDEFWEVMRNWSKDNFVLVSELIAPNDFICIWEKLTSRSINTTNKSKDTEKLFIYKDGLFAEQYE